MSYYLKLVMLNWIETSMWHYKTKVKLIMLYNAEMKVSKYWLTIWTICLKFRLAYKRRSVLEKFNDFWSGHRYFFQGRASSSVLAFLMEFCELVSLREWRFFHFSWTTVSVRLSTPTAFTAAVISNHTCFFFKLVTLLVNLLCRMAKFSSTVSVKTEISEALKLCFLGVRDPSPEAILVLFAGCKQQTPNFNKELTKLRLRNLTSG